MLKLAEHIIETKTEDFKPDAFVDYYETAVVELLKQKQSGKAVSQDRRERPHEAGRQRYRPAEKVS